MNYTCPIKLSVNLGNLIYSFADIIQSSKLSCPKLKSARREIILHNELTLFSDNDELDHSTS